jgi:hypothetical protein
MNALSALRMTSLPWTMAGSAPRHFVTHRAHQVAAVWERTPDYDDPLAQHHGRGAATGRARTAGRGSVSEGQQPCEQNETCDALHNSPDRLACLAPGRKGKHPVIYASATGAKRGNIKRWPVSTNAAEQPSCACQPLLVPRHHDRARIARDLPVRE